MEIHESVKRSNFPNATTLATKLEVSTKTIHRDIQFMRDRWGLPIEFDAAYNGFRYTHPVESFPMLQINEGELFALLIADKALQNYRGTVFEKRLSRIKEACRRKGGPAAAASRPFRPSLDRDSTTPGSSLVM